MRAAFVPLALVLLLVLPCCDGDPPPPPARPAQLLLPDPDAIHLAGTGAMGPLAGRLAQSFVRRPGTGPLRIRVEESIGSGGGIRAVADGAIDLGMVSRPLDASERALGLIELTIARDAVVLAAHPAVEVRGVTSDELRQLYAGTRRTFADGSPAVLFLRDRRESANAALERVLPGLTALRESSYRDRRHTVLYHDGAMAGALSDTPGAFGVFSLGALLAHGLALKVLTLDDRAPTAAALADGSWRATRDLTFVYRRDRAARTRPFLAFITSKEGRQITQASGYLPLPAEGVAP